jgi:hypothetical protein
VGHGGGLVDFSQLNTNSSPINNIEESHSLLLLSLRAPRLTDQARPLTLKSHFEPRVSCIFFETMKTAPPVPFHHKALDANGLASPSAALSIPTDSGFSVDIGISPV